MTAAGRHVFGPVRSRRLGRSLGVDLVPFKTCSYNCIYCQLDPTTHLTTQPGRWFAPDDVARQIADRLDTQPDYITLSGCGEPTLYERIDELINRIKAITDVPVAVVTNGSLLWQPRVRRQLLAADLIIPSLDAGDAETFATMNRPAPDITFERMVDGLIQMRAQFAGRYWLEVFVVAAINDSEQQMQKIAHHARRIAPDCVQLNTAVRPPAESWARGVTSQRLGELARCFDPPAEVIAAFHHDQHAGDDGDDDRRHVLELIRRHPCTIGDVAAGLGIKQAAVVRHIEALKPQLSTEKVNDHTYYTSKPAAN